MGIWAASTGTLALVVMPVSEALQDASEPMEEPGLGILGLTGIIRAKRRSSTGKTDGLQ